MTAALRYAALRYAAHGWPVFPCRPRMKVPATAHGLLDATTDAGLIEAWWQQWPDANVAMVTGRTSGVFTLDADGEKGMDSLRELQRENAPLPPTARIATPGGGEHRHFKHPGEHLRNSAGQLGPGLDTRGDGGYVLVPPSVGAGGRRYESIERAPLAPAPDWLLERLRGCSQHVPNGQCRREPTDTWVAYVRDGLPAGERNAGLARLVGHLLHQDVDVHLVAEIAHLVNTRCRPPLDSTEVDRVVASIAGREVRRRTKGRT